MAKTRRHPRKKPAQKRSQETWRAILTAAARILERDGYDKTNVNRVAELAGVSVGSLYQYFPSKEALVAEVARDLSKRMVSTFQDGIVDLAFVPMRDACTGVVERSVRAFRLQPRLREIILLEMPAHLFDTREFDDLFAEALRYYFEFHRERIRPQNLDLAIAVLRSAVEAVSSATAARGDREDEVIEELSHLVYHYIACKDG